MSKGTGGIGNTGQVTTCAPRQAVTHSIILMYEKDGDGNKNFLDLNDSGTFNEAYFQAKVNEPDPLKRWYPLPKMEEVDQPPEDSKTKEYASGRMVKLRDGKRHFEGKLVDEFSTPTFEGKLKTIGCSQLVSFETDIDGNLIGEVELNSNEFYPSKINSSSWDVRRFKPKDDDAAYIHLQFDWDLSVKSENQSIVTCNEAGQDFTELEGLLDVQILNLAVLVLSSTFTAELEYGSAIGKIPYQNFILTTDWEAYNVTSDAVVVIDLVTFTSPTSYQIDHALGVAVGNTLRISTDRDGFEGSAEEVAV